MNQEDAVQALGRFPPLRLRPPPFVGEVSPLRLRPSHFVGEVSPLRLRPTTLDCTLPWSIHHRTDGMPLGDLPRPPPSAQGPLRCARSTGNKKKKREHEKEQIISKKRPLLSRRPCLGKQKHKKGTKIKTQTKHNKCTMLFLFCKHVFLALLICVGF